MLLLQYYASNQDMGGFYIQKYRCNACWLSICSVKALIIILDFNASLHFEPQNSFVSMNNIQHTEPHLPAEVFKTGDLAFQSPALFVVSTPEQSRCLH